MFTLRSFLPLVILSFIFTAACGSNVGDTNTATDNTASVSNDFVVTEDEDVAGQAASGESAADAPELLIAELYKAHDAQKGPFYERKRAVIDKYFAKALADAVWKDEQRPNDQMSAFGADPLYDGQDFEIKKFSVGKGEVNGDKATVTATFENFGEKKSIVFSMLMQGDNWKISDIKYASGLTLSSVYRKNSILPDKKEQDIGSIGEFEGRYRVGDTFCTVKPVKMAFEVRWDKGTGFETFHFEGRNEVAINFVSQPEPGKYNVFAFNDDNYNSGTFIRADGKTFPLSRVK